MSSPTPPLTPGEGKNEPERHEIRTDTPGWDTKQRCTCGYESPSKAEQWKHAADELRSAIDAKDVEIARQAESCEFNINQLEASHEALAAAEEKVAALEAERDELRAKLWIHGDHCSAECSPDCDEMHTYEQGCWFAPAVKERS